MWKVARAARPCRACPGQGWASGMGERLERELHAMDCSRLVPMVGKTAPRRFAQTVVIRTQRPSGVTSPVREGEVSLFPRSIGSLLKAIQYGARSISHPADPPRSPRGLLACCLLCPQWRWPLTTPRTMLQVLFTIAILP